MVMSCEACDRGWYHFVGDCPLGVGLILTGGNMENKGYPCKDCKRTFETVRDFCDHFKREETSEVIIGCKDVDKGE